MRSQVLVQLLSNFLITAPTLIIWVNRDEVLPIAHAYVMPKDLLQMLVMTFLMAGHFPQIEHQKSLTS